MNKKFLIILLLLATLFPTSYAFTTGYSGIGASNVNDAEDRIYSNNYTLTIDPGYAIDVTSFWVYSNNATANVKVHGAVYDENLKLLYESEQITVNGAGWYECEISATLLSGDYWLAAGYENGTYHYYTSFDYMQGEWSSGYTFPETLTQFAYGDLAYSFYIEYDIVPLGGDPAVWAGVYTFGLIALFGIILIMFKMKIPILQIAVGVLGVMVPLGLWAETSILFTPFLQTIIVVTSFILVAYSTWSYRQGI